MFFYYLLGLVIFYVALIIGVTGDYPFQKRDTWEYIPEESHEDSTLSGG